MARIKPPTKGHTWIACNGKTKSQSARCAKCNVLREHYTVNRQNVITYSIDGKNLEGNPDCIVYLDGIFIKHKN